MAGRAWALAALRRGNRLKARASRSRGQALVEFALVLPLLFTIIFAFIVLAVFMVDNSILNHAAISGARVGNGAMGNPPPPFVSLNSQLTNTSTANVTMTLTPYPFAPASGRAYGPYSTSNAGVTGCLKQRNAASYLTVNGQQYNTNTAVLGWDWGPRMCGTQVIVTEAQLTAPLVAAALASDSSVRGLLLGQRGAGTDVVVTACYADAAGNCLVSVTLTDTGAGAPAVAMPAYANSVTFRTEAAPSFLKVDASVTVISLVDIPLISSFIPAQVTLNAHAIEVLDRFLPACPAPDTGAPPVGGCGSIY